MDVFKVVTTKSGPVRGIEKETAAKVKYYLFQGIPYVQQPIGDLKFRDPQPIEAPWTEVLDCTKEGPPTYNFDFFKKFGPEFVGGDNSLNVNIFTPEVSRECYVA